MSQKPRHIAIIMDGNGRWAKQHKVAIALGHRAGVESLREIIRFSSDSGIEVLSLYAFSTENWRRSPDEVSALMGLILDFFASEIDELDEKNVRIRILGDKDGLPSKQATTVCNAEERTKDNTGLQLNIALNYGGQDEILRATKALAMKVQQGELAPEQIQWSDFERELYTKDQPPVDLLIRTSGEMRVSNFLLCQIAYAEMVFPKVLWPDYTVEMYQKDLDAFAHRERRYGGRSK